MKCEFDRPISHLVKYIIFHLEKNCSNLVHVYVCYKTSIFYFIAKLCIFEKKFCLLFLINQDQDIINNSSFPIPYETGLGF